MFLVHLENSLKSLILMFDNKKRQTIYGTVIEACDERNYTIRFDFRKVVVCFSNTLYLENCATSLPPPELQAAAAHVEAQGVHADEHAAIVGKENEAAVQDSVEEENLPHNGPEDDESEDEGPAKGADPAVGAEEEKPVQHPVGIVAKAPACRKKGSSTQPNLSISGSSGFGYRWMITAAGMEGCL
jgi:hypothetical protein